MPDKKAGEGFHKQMARHMFSAFLLWYFSKHEGHGYELLKKIEAEEGGLKVITASQLYPLLKDMTKQGLLRQTKAMQGKRARKIYQLTDKGREALRDIRRKMHAKPLRRQFLREMVE
jgi:DNA-binding PadR family transcriptional regulator